MIDKNTLVTESYDGLLRGVVHLFEEARKTSARSVNAIMTATYWEIGRRIVEHEQEGKRRANYGEALIARLAADLTARFRRGFSETNLKQMREFYLAWPIRQTLSDGSEVPTRAGARHTWNIPNRTTTASKVSSSPSRKPLRMVSLRQLSDRCLWVQVGCSQKGYF